VPQPDRPTHYAEMVAGRVVKVLLDTQIDLGRDHGGMAQGELDLLKWGLAHVSEPRKRAP
jgi:hypothetical protein